MNEEFDASIENVEALLVELNRSENELLRLQNQLLALKEMVCRKRNKIVLSSKDDLQKINDTKITNESTLALRKVKSQKEFSAKSSVTSIGGGIPCNKLVKNKILRYKSLIGNIECFNTETKEKKKFIDGLRKENQQDMLNNRKKYQIVNRFLETFTS